MVNDHITSCFRCQEIANTAKQKESSPAEDNAKAIRK